MARDRHETFDHRDYENIAPRTGTPAPQLTKDERALRDARMWPDRDANRIREGYGLEPLAPEAIDAWLVGV